MERARLSQGAAARAPRAPAHLFEGLKGKALHLLNEPWTSAANHSIINNAWAEKQGSAAKNISIVLVTLTLACKVVERLPSYWKSRSWVTSWK